MINLRQENALKAARRRFEMKELLSVIKSRTPCAICGNKFHPCQMDYVKQAPDRDGKPISKMLLMSKKTMLKLIAKCDLICANCHRLKLFNERKQTGKL